MVEPLPRKRPSCRDNPQYIWQQISSVNFLYWQYIYYFFLYLVSSLIFLVSGLKGEKNVGYLTSLFLCISAGTGAGLNTVDLSTLNTFQQFILWVNIIMGSHTFVFAGLVIALRIKYKQKKTREEKHRAEIRQALGLAESSGRTHKTPQSNTPTLSGNIEELEMRYQAFSLLSWIVPLYIIMVQFCGAIALGWFISARHPSIPAENHVNAWWSGIFLSISAFNNSGMSLINANMAPFQQSYFVLLAMSGLILLGNTLFPILLRIIIKLLARFIPRDGRWRGWGDGLRLLTNEKSRILCPYLFTRSELFWLAGTVLIFNGIDWAAFGISAAGNPAFKDIPVKAQVIDGLFQAFAVRSGGFGVVSIPSLRIGVQATYILMMYISSFPISPDNIWEPETPGAKDPFSREELCEKPEGFVVRQKYKLGFFKRQFRRTFTVDDFWLLSAFVWIISVIETSHFEADPAAYSVFNIVFEVISAYGCVGVSMGHPDSSTSFSGSLRGGCQLILCGVMLLGRTREARVGVFKGDWGIGASFPGMEGERELEFDEGVSGAPTIVSSV